MFDTIIKSGIVVTEHEASTLDVGIKDGKVAALSVPGALEAEAGHTIDATGLYVLPGGIDAHVHFDFAISEVMQAQSAEAGSRAAAFGGTTTYIDFAFQQGDGGLVEAIQQKLDRTGAQAVNVDYAFHAILSGDFPLHLTDEIREAVSGGIVSFKMFTAFRGSQTIGGMYTDDGRIYSVMKEAAKHNAAAMVHCEDECIIDYNVRRLYAEGREQFWNIPEARPALAEEAAVRRMLLLARRTGCPLYVVHVSAKDSMEAIVEGRGQGIAVGAEVLHPQLLFTPDSYIKEQGQRYMNYPPNKSDADRQALWEGCADGSLQTIASDDYTISLERKLVGDTVDNCTGGTNSVETRLAIFWSEGVAKRNIDVRRYVAMTAANPARLFGLYGKKGVIAPGADADIVILDPNETHTYRQDANLHSDCDYSNWDGWQTDGFPVTTMLRGTVLVDRGKWVGPTGSGKFVPGGVPELS